MSDLTRYRLPINDEEHAYRPVTDGRCKECFQHPQRCAVPDSTLQDIADAVKAYKEFDYEPYINSDGDEPLENDPAHVLNALLDELSNDAT